jgi:hypothetical protein
MLNRFYSCTGTYYIVLLVLGSNCLTRGGLRVDIDDVFVGRGVPFGRRCTAQFIGNPSNDCVGGIDADDVILDVDALVLLFRCAVAG